MFNFYLVCLVSCLTLIYLTKSDGMQRENTPITVLFSFFPIMNVLILVCLIADLITSLKKRPWGCKIKHTYHSIGNDNYQCSKCDQKSWTYWSIGI